METRIPTSWFMSATSKSLRQVETTGQPLVITDSGEPVIEIRRHATNAEGVLRLLRGSVLRFDNPTEPVA